MRGRGLGASAKECRVRCIRHRSAVRPDPHPGSRPTGRQYRRRLRSCGKFTDRGVAVSDATEATRSAGRRDNTPNRTARSSLTGSHTGPDGQSTPVTAPAVAPPSAPTSPKATTSRPRKAQLFVGHSFGARSMPPRPPATAPAMSPIATCLRREPRLPRHVSRLLRSALESAPAAHPGELARITESPSMLLTRPRHHFPLAVRASRGVKRT